MKEWEVLSDQENDEVWRNIEKRFKFNPYGSPFLALPEPYYIYNLHLFTKYLKDKSIVIDDEYYRIFTDCIENILGYCMGIDDFIYALDWHHTCFRYNPKSLEKMPHEMKMEDYTIYFPEFYPDGDYYFFVAKDFSWGYFGHPWTQQLWIFGKELVEEIKKVPSRYLTLKV